MAKKKKPKKKKQAKNWGKEEEPQKPSWARKYLIPMGIPVAAAGAGLFFWLLAGSNPEDAKPSMGRWQTYLVEEASDKDHYAEMEKMFQLARRNVSMQDDFVEKVKESIVLPEYIDDIVYSKGDSRAGDSTTAMITAPEISAIFDGEKLEDKSCVVTVYPRAFAIDGSIVRYADFMSCLAEHEFLHGLRASKGGVPLIERCMAKDGKGFKKGLYEAIIELEAYGSQIRTHLKVGDDALILKDTVSLKYSKSILFNYLKNFKALKSTRSWEDMPPGAIDSLVEEYDIPQLKFAHLKDW